MNDNTNIQHEDGIDLVELIVNLWHEKIIIVLTIFIVASLGALYAYTTPPIYIVSAQLLLPQQSELNDYISPYEPELDDSNITKFYQIEPDVAFTKFLSTLANNDHIFNVAQNSPISNAEMDPIEVINEMRTIQYPNTIKKNNEMSPEIYTLNYEGENRDELISLINYDLDIAKFKTIKDINEQYTSSLEKQIGTIESLNLAKERVLDIQLKTRKSYILQARENEIARLKESLNLAKQLEIKEPTSLSKLAGINSIIDFTNNNQSNNNRNQTSDNEKGLQSPIEKFDSLSQYNSHLSNKNYLRGERILTAEIESLQRIENNFFLDEHIIVLNNTKELLKASPLLEQLSFLLNKAKFSQDITFYSENLYAPQNPIKPKKALIIAVSILLGGIMGLFIAIGRIVYKHTKEISDKKSA